MRCIRAELPSVVLLLLLPLIVFAPVALGNRTLLPADALYTFEPFRSGAAELGVGQVQNPLLADLVLENYLWQRLIQDAIKTGQLPLWDPFIFAGHPFLANGQHSALYPLRMIIFHLLPLPRAYGVFIVVQLGLAGIWMYMLTRVIGANRLGALLAGITFQLCSFLVVSAVHPMIVAAASWLPLLLALLELTLRRARFWKQERALLPWVLLGALALALEILAGHAETTYFTLLVMGGFAVWRLGQRWLMLPKSARKAEVLTPAWGAALLVALGLGLGAVQLMPLYEIVSQSFRQGAVTLAQVLEWAYPKRRILTFLIPNFFGNPTHHTGELLRATVNAYGKPISSFDWGMKNYVEGGAYLGLLPLLLATIAVFNPFTPQIQNLKSKIQAWLRDPYIPFFTALTLFALGCIFGTPLYALVYILPFMGQSHSPFRWVFPLSVAVAALAGLGATRMAEYRFTHGPDGWASERESEKARRRGLRSTQYAVRLFFLDTTPNLISGAAGLTIWGGVLLLGGLWVSRLAFEQLEPLVTHVFMSMAKAADAFPDVRAFYSYEFHWIQQAALLLIATGAALRVSRCPIYLPAWLKRRPAWEALAVIVLVVDLVAFGAGFNPQVDPALLSYTPPVVEFLRQDTGLWRFTAFDPHGAKTFNPNAGMYFNFQDIRGYDSLFTAQYARYMGWIEPQGELPYNRIASFGQFSSLDSPLTDLLNVKYVVSEVEIPLPKYREVYNDGALRVYENLTAMPRAFSLPQTATLVVRDVEAVGAAIQTYDPRFYAIVEASAVGPQEQAPQRAEPQPQAVVAYELNQVVIEANANEAAWLILGDSYFPGWKAFARPQGTGENAEVELSIARIAGNFRGVQLTPGAWIVRFKYSPDSVKFGAFSAFLAGMVLLFLAVLWLWRLTYREQAEQSTVQRLAKNSIAPIVLNLFNRAVDFAFAALMLRILGPANAGDYYYVINVFMWFDIVTNFGLNTYLIREAARHRAQARRYLFNTTLLRLGFAVLTLPLLAGFIGVRQTLVAALTNPASRQAIFSMLLLYVGLVPNSLSTGLSALFYGHEKAEYPAAVTTISTLIKVALGTLVLLTQGGIVGLAGASIVTNLATLAILGTLAWQQIPALRAASAFPLRQLRDTTERVLRREMVRESWPLMVNHLLATLFFKIDVPLMEAILGSAVLGLYSTGYKYLEALMVIPSMFTMALFPIISRKAGEDRPGFIRFYQLGVKILVVLVLPAALIATLGARELVLILGGPEYLPGGMIALQFMAWSMLIGWINSLTQYVLIALNQQRHLMRVYLLAFAFSLISNLLLMPRYGYPAAALLHTAAELALFVPFIMCLHRQIGRLNWGVMLGKPMLAAAATAPVIVLLLPLHRGLALLAALAVYGVVAWRIGVFDATERDVLAPLLKRS